MASVMINSGATTKGNAQVRKALDVHTQALTAKALPGGWSVADVTSSLPPKTAKVASKLNAVSRAISGNPAIPYFVLGTSSGSGVTAVALKHDDGRAAIHIAVVPNYACAMQDPCKLLRAAVKFLHTHYNIIDAKATLDATILCPNYSNAACQSWIDTCLPEWCNVTTMGVQAVTELGTVVAAKTVPVFTIAATDETISANSVLRIKIDGM